MMDNEPTGFWILRRTEMKKTNGRKREMSLTLFVAVNPKNSP
jgi:hypothetical protein